MNDAAEQVPEVERADHHKHMDYVQAAITRLANNSFVMKGWALTLATAVLGFAVSRGQWVLATAALVPAVAFWMLDTYFLRQERAFRHLFRDVAEKRVTGFAMNPRGYAKREPRLQVMFSWSLLAFYGAIIAVTVLVAAVLGLVYAEASDPAPSDPAREVLEHDHPPRGADELG